MSITKQLTESDEALSVHLEGYWDEDFDGIMSGYTSFNDAGVECETGDFLYGMVRILQPERVLETGTHWGIGASYIASGLRDNGKGVLDTIELDLANLQTAHVRFKKLGLLSYINEYQMKAESFSPLENGVDLTPLQGSDFSSEEYMTQRRKVYDLILLDTEPNLRFDELIKFYPYLKDGGYMFIHDLHRHMSQHANEEHGFGWPFGKVPSRMKELLEDGKLKSMHFPTPRGLTGFYKPHPDDYKTNV